MAYGYHVPPGTSSMLFAVNEAVQNWILGYDVACKGKGMWTWGMVS